MKKILVLVLLCCVLSLSLMGFSRIRTNSGEPLRLSSTNVQFVLSDKIATAPNILLGGDPISALNAARQEWNQLSTSAISFLPFTTSSQTIAKGDDGVNLITFSDTSEFTTDKDALAITVINVGIPSGVVSDTDVVFNPNATFFVVPGDKGFDIQSVATHEFGHAITADHTAVQSATMYQSGAELEFFQRTLDSDDIAFAVSTYPTANHPFGSIAGKVLSGSTAVFGAHVVAYDPAKNIYISGVSLRDGSYFIDSVPPGNYSLYAEPFDGPVTLSSLFSGQINTFFGSANTKFKTADGPAQPVAVGQTIQNANISVPSGNATLNLTNGARNFAPPSNSINKYRVSPGPILLTPGEGQSVPITVAVLGDGITEGDSGLKLDIEGSGITIKARGIGKFTDGTAFALADIAVAPDAAPGPRQVKVITGGQTSYYTAGVIIAEQNVTQSFQRFAAVRQSSAEFTGIGITNLSSQSTVVRALYYDSTGKLISIPGMVNPATLSVPAGGQVAKLSQEIFQAVQQESGWVELQADQTQVYSFFLTGDFALTRLDGSDVPRSPLTDGIFTDVRQDATYQTEINVANLNTTSATLSFQFVGIGPTATQKLGPVSKTIAPRANLRITASDLFPGIFSNLGYITFHSTQPVYALELLSSNVALVSLNAQDLNAASTTLITPHFAVGNAGLTFFSRLYLANPGNQPVSVEINARDASGKNVGAPQVQVINVQTILKIEVADTFSVLPAGPPVIGSITVKSLSGGSLFGSILFGDGAALVPNFASELPLESVTSLGKDLLFEQLATAGAYFTGLAIYNPNPVSAQITIEVHAPSGALLGTTQQTLGPNQKVTNQIPELIPAAANQAGGYIRVRSDQPVSAIVLFGTGTGSVLSAVPASRVVP